MTRKISHRDYERLKREHEELRELLGKIHRCLAKRLETVAGVAEMLDSLEEHLTQHFAGEEEFGFFDQVAESAPRLSESAFDLRGEHQQLLKSLQTVCDQASTTDGEDWWVKLAEAFHGFSTELMHHESKENEILLSAYDDDIGETD